MGGQPGRELIKRVCEQFLGVDWPQETSMLQQGQQLASSAVTLNCRLQHCLIKDCCIARDKDCQTSACSQMHEVTRHSCKCIW